MAKKKNHILELQRKNQIMLSTYEFLVSGSVTDLTLDRVATACKISKGLVSYYFKNKDNLILETIVFILGQEKQTFLNLAYQEQPVENRVRALIEAALPSRSKVENMAHFLMEVWSYTKNNPTRKKILQESFRGIRSICKNIVELGLSLGYFKDTDAESMSLILQSLFDGLMIQITLDSTLSVEKIHETMFHFIEQYLSK